MISTPHFDRLDHVLSHFARATPGVELAVDGATRITWAGAQGQVTQLAGWMAAQGVTQGDRVALSAQPGLDYLLVLMAVSRLGAIYVGLNPRCTTAEAAHALSLTRPVLVLASARNVAHDLAAAANGTPVLAMPDEAALGAARAPPACSAGHRDVAVIVFTSGSTGKPKAAALHHGGLLASALAQHDTIDRRPSRYLSNLPINHVGAVMNLTMACLVGGGSLVFQGKFDAAAAIRLIAREQVETWMQVPTMFTLAVNHADFLPSELASLRAICVGGGALSASTLAQLRRLGVPIFVEYGQTEVMSTIACSDPGAPDDVLLNSVGRLDPRFETRLVDAQGNPCPPGTVGEIQARGNCTFRQYWADPAATQAAFTADGWLHTGDLGFVRPDGNLTLAGRLHEMIKSGGYNVYPREVEAVIEGHPAVAEVVVYGTPDPLFGEAVHCVVELTGAEELTLDMLKAHCAGVLANYKIPKQMLVLPSLPRLPNGKIDRAAIAGQRPGLA